VEEVRRGYRKPSGRHRHCPGTTAADWRRHSGGSSTATDRAVVVGRLVFGLSWTDFPKAGPHYLLWRWATWGRNHVYGCASDQGAERDLTAFLSPFSRFLIFWIFGVFYHQKFQHSHVVFVKWAAPFPSRCTTTQNIYKDGQNIIFRDGLRTRT
jgi:hypothetical protein